MDPASIRPRFDLAVGVTAEVALERLRVHLLRPDFRCRGWVAPPYAELEVHAATKHFWSPRLAVHAVPVREVGNEGCVLHCRFQPEPDVWTMYMAGWGILVVAGAVAVAWTCAAMLMGDASAMPLVSIAVIAALAFALWWAALAGQRIGAEQMVELRASLDEALVDLVRDRAPSSGG